VKYTFGFSPLMTANILSTQIS